MDLEWKRQLRREASARRMCQENRSALESVTSKGEAIALYKKTIDWALEEGYPRLDTLRQYFSDCEDLGIYIDRHFDGEILDSQKVYVFHHCSGIIRTGLNVPKRIIPMCYFGNGCTMTIKPSETPGLEVRVPLYIFGDNRIATEPSESVLFKSYKFEVK